MKCVCGIKRSNTMRVNMKTLDCSFSNVQKFPEIPSRDLQILNLKGNDIVTLDRSIAELADLKGIDVSGKLMKSIG